MCKILYHGSGDGGGTGTFVADNVILTCSHIFGDVDENENMDLYDLKDFTVRVYNSPNSFEEYKVKDRIKQLENRPLIQPQKGKQGEPTAKMAPAKLNNVPGKNNNINVPPSFKTQPIHQPLAQGKILVHGQQIKIALKVGDMKVGNVGKVSYQMGWNGTKWVPIKRMK